MKVHLTLLLCLSAAIANAQGANLPYYTGFDNKLEQLGWEQYHTGDLGSSDWGYGVNGFSMPSCISHDYNVGGNPSDTVIDWYVSPPLNFTGPAQIALKVRTSGFSEPFVDNCEVWYGTDDPDPATGNFQLLGNLSYMAPQFTWLDTTFETSFIAENVYIAIRYKTVGAYWMTYAVDNINIATAQQITFPGGPPLLSVFPNPMLTSATVLLGQHSADTQLSIHDIFGRQVRIISMAQENQLRLHRENFERGVYFIRMTRQGEVIATEKLVVTD